MGTPAETLPLTASLLAEGGTALHGVHVLHVNHRLPDVHVLSSLLTEHGADMTFIGIPYDEREWPPRPGRSPWRARMVSTVTEALHDLPEDLVVIEDGAYAVEAATASGTRLRFAVEQTRFGHDVARGLLDSGQLTFPVISCARSTVKCRVESQFLGLRLAEVLSEFLTQLGEFLTGRRVLLIGYGILGRPLALRLSAAYRCHVSVVERSEVVADVARADGFKVADTVTSADESPEIVVAATGTESVQWPELAALAGSARWQPLVLASVSSGDVEFRRALIDGQADGSRLRTIAQRPWGVELSVDGRDVRLLADGRPVNFFHSTSHSLGAAAADLINARLVEALLFEARRERGGGRVDKWSVREGDHPWLDEESFLQRFCLAARVPVVGHTTAVAALHDIGLHDVHPAEYELGVAR